MEMSWRAIEPRGTHRETPSLGKTWLGCVTLHRVLCFSGLSLPSVQGVGRAGLHLPGPVLRSPLKPPAFALSPLIALDVRPLAAPSPVPSVPSTAWLSLSPLTPYHGLSPPPSLPLLSGWALACSSLLCLWTPAPARPGSHSDGCKGTSSPHPPAQAQSPNAAGSPPPPSSLFLLPPLLPGAVSVEGSGHWGSAGSFPMTRCVTLGMAQFSLTSLSPWMV